MHQRRLREYVRPDGGWEELDKDTDIEVGDRLLVVFETKDSYQWPQSEPDYADDPYSVPDQFERRVYKKSLGNFGMGWVFEVDEGDTGDNAKYDKFAISGSPPILKRISKALSQRGEDVDFSIRLNWHEYPVRVYQKA